MYKKLVYPTFFILFLSFVANADAQPGRGNILFEYWESGVGTTLDTLIGLIRYPDKPTSSEWRTSFEGKATRGPNYGTRVRGYLHPSQSGSYTFWITSDDQSQLFLSTNDNPANAVLIAEVSAGVAPHSWDTYDAQKSEEINLEAGGTYYIEAIQVHGIGWPDHLSVAWAGPGIANYPVVIQGNYLSPFLRVRDYKASNPNPKDEYVGVNPTLPIVQWQASSLAVTQDVYFGTSEDLGPDDKVGRKIAFDTLYFHAAGFVPAQTYYWRIDTIDADQVVHTGDVWSFMSQPYKAYSPFPSDGAKCVEPDIASLTWQVGYGATKQEIYFGTNSTDVTNGTGSTYKGEFPLGGQFSPPKCELNTTYYWRVDQIKTDGTKYIGDVWHFSTVSPGGGLKGEYFSNNNFITPTTLTRTDPGINFYWDTAGPGVSCRWTGELIVPATDTYTFYTICNTNDFVRVWLDDEVIIEDWVAHYNVEDRSPPISLAGGQVYPIRLDFLRTGDAATIQLFWESARISKQIIPPCFLQPPVRANTPKPDKRAVNIKQNPKLSWTAGDKAAQHDVYFGTDKYAVAEADPTTTGIYRGQQTTTYYIPPEAPLEWNTTYYWRIDEVNIYDPESPWKGSVWSFTTADAYIVDDFEGYDTGDNQIWFVWKDGWGYAARNNLPAYPGNGTGSAVGDENSPTYMETGTVHGGEQSCPFVYNNSAAPFYSEIMREWEATQDWTADDVVTLTLWFNGDSDNPAEPLYVAVEDSAGTIKLVTHQDPTAVQLGGWQQWDIALSQFSDVGVDLTAVKTMYIGVGNKAAPQMGDVGFLFFDDIQLSAP